MGRSHNRGGQSSRERMNNKRKLQQQRLRRMEAEEEARMTRQSVLAKKRPPLPRSTQEITVMDQESPKHKRPSVLRVFIPTVLLWLPTTIVVVAAIMGIIHGF